MAACAVPSDPITNSPLPSAALTPVFPMRSRAAEYREAAARAAAARAAAPSCADPLLYLQRAAELLSPCYAAAGATRSSSTSGGVAAPKVPGMTAEFVRYLLQNRSPAYGTLALKYFANELRRGALHVACGGALLRGDGTWFGWAARRGEACLLGMRVSAQCFQSFLLQAATSRQQVPLFFPTPGSLALMPQPLSSMLAAGGYIEAAAAVLYRLLLAAEDRQQQAEFLKLCLDCWSITGGGSDEGASHTGGSGSSATAGARGEGARVRGRLRCGCLLNRCWLNDPCLTACSFCCYGNALLLTPVLC